eukprot:2133133-Karenia_brevis.AAC.1
MFSHGSAHKVGDSMGVAAAHMAKRAGSVFSLVKGLKGASRPKFLPKVRHFVHERGFTKLVNK